MPKQRDARQKNAPAREVTVVRGRPPVPVPEPSERKTRRWPAWELVLLAALTLLAAAVRLYRLNALGLWEDEGWTSEVARRSIPEILDYCAGDFAPPLYYLLIHFWTPLWPGDVGLRLPSVFCGVIAVPLIYLCGRAAHSPRAGLIAALLLIPNTFHVRYSQEARCYALYFAASLAAVLATLLLAQRPTRARWTGWVVAVTLMLYAHCTAPVYVIALSGLFWALQSSPRDPVWRNWLGAHAAAVALFLPWSFAFARQTSRVIADHLPAKLAAPTLGTVGESLLQMLTVPFVHEEAAPVGRLLEALLLAAPFATLTVWSLLHRRAGSIGRPAAGLLLFGLGAWGLIFLVSVTVRPIYILRVLIPSLGALLIVTACAVAAAEKVAQRALAAALVGLLLLSGGLSLALFHHDFRKQEIRRAVQYALEHAREGDALAFVQDRLRPAIDHYLQGSPMPLIRTGLFRFSKPGYFTGGMTPGQAATELSKVSSLWVVELEDPAWAEKRQETRAWLATFMQPADDKAFYQIRLRRFTGSAWTSPGSPAGRGER